MGGGVAASLSLHQKQTHSCFFFCCLNRIPSPPQQSAFFAPRFSSASGVARWDHPRLQGFYRLNMHNTQLNNTSFALKCMFLNNHSAADFVGLGGPEDLHKKASGGRSNLKARASKTPHEVTQSFLQALSNNFLPLALLSTTVAGLVWPTPGQLAQQWGLSKWAVFSIFLISGLILQDGELAKAMDAWPLGLFGLASILFLTPMAAYTLLNIQFSPRELVTGLAIFCCVPTTLSSGVSLTQLVGANTTLALILTVTSNLIGAFTIPLVLSMLFSHGIGVSIPVQPLLIALLQSLLVPLCIGKGIRSSFSVIKSFVDERRHLLSMLNSALLSLFGSRPNGIDKAFQLRLFTIVAYKACHHCPRFHYFNHSTATKSASLELLFTLS